MIMGIFASLLVLGCTVPDACKNNPSEFQRAECYQNLAIENANLVICEKVERTAFQSRSAAFSMEGCKNYVYLELAKLKAIWFPMLVVCLLGFGVFAILIPIVGGWFVKFIASAVRNFSHALRVVAVFLLLAMLFLTVTDVFLRYFLNRPIVGSVELTEMLMAGVVFFSFAYCTMTDGNVKVELFVNHLPQRAQWAFDIFTYLLSLGLFILITWQSFIEMRRVFQIQMESELLHIPYYPSYIVLIVGSIGLCLVIVMMLVESVHKVLKR